MTETEALRWVNMLPNDIASLVRILRNNWCKLGGMMQTEPSYSPTVHLMRRQTDELEDELVEKSRLMAHAVRCIYPTLREPAPVPEKPEKRKFKRILDMCR